jgi:hypothetical protein
VETTWHAVDNVLMITKHRIDISFTKSGDLGHSGVRVTRRLVLCVWPKRQKDKHRSTKHTYKIKD